MKALYALCLSLAAFAFARPAQAELKYLSYEVQSGTVKELTAEEVEKLDVTDKRWHETITAEDGTQTKTTEMLFVQDTDISTEYYIGVFEVTQAQAHHLGLGQAVSNLGSAYGVEYSNTGFPFASTPTLNNKPGLAFPKSDQWLAYASTSEGKLATSDKDATNLRGGATITSSSELKAWYKDKRWQEGANIHGVIDIFGNAAEYTCDLGEDGSPVVAFYGWPAESNNTYSWKKLQDLTSPAETRLDAYNIGGSITDIWGARLVYTVPAARTYTLTVTLDGTEVSKQEGINEGVEVTVTPPTPAEWHRLSGCTIAPPQKNLQPPTGEALERPYTFQMPAADLTFAYTSEPYGTITVEGGTATVTHGEEIVAAGKNTQVVEGDTVTLDADEAGSYQFFVQWNGADGDTLTVDENLMEKETVIEAVYQYYPRVIIVGGTATVAEADAENSFGNGYYATDTVLTLEAETLSGYKFSGWTVDKADMADALDTERGTYTIGANDAGTTVTLTATYAYDESGESGTVTPADIHLGSTLAEGVYTAHPLFGWTPAEEESAIPDTAGNRYLSYPYENAGLFAMLPLAGDDRTITYQDVEPTRDNPAPERPTAPTQPNFSELPLDQREAAMQEWLKEREEYLKKMDEYWKEYEAWLSSASASSSLNTSRLLLRRVSPTTEGKRDFYLGVFETPIGNIANLEKLAKGSTSYDTSSKAPFCARTTGARDYLDLNSYLTLINGQFNLSARFPTQEDVYAVGDQTRANPPDPANPGAGYGLGRPDRHGENYDINLVCDVTPANSMVVAQGGNSKPANADGMKVDPYGFYGLWGNCWEASSNGAGFGGSTDFAAERDADLNCRTDVTTAEYPGGRAVLALRPAIDVEAAVVIYVGEKNSATAVQVAPGQDLFADPSVLPTKALSRCTGWTLGGKAIKAGDNYTVTTEDDGKVLVPKWEETPVSIPVKCKNCLGPATAYPGQIVTVYPLEGMAFAAEAPLTSSNSDVEVGTPAADGTITVTFPNTLPLDSKITLTGKLVPIEEPEPEPEVKPGYRFRLR